MAAMHLAFYVVVDACGVLNNFRAWLVQNTICDRNMFLLGARNNSAYIDADLIDTCGL